MQIGRQRGVIIGHELTPREFLPDGTVVSYDERTTIYVPESQETFTVLGIKGALRQEIEIDVNVIERPT